jgi:hypothetical protein
VSRALPGKRGAVDKILVAEEAVLYDNTLIGVSGGYRLVEAKE